jgi:hypothetical protein
MRLLKLLLILLSCAVAQPAFADPSLDASVAYENGDYSTALRLFAPLAEQGDVTAAFYLGLMYEEGKGVTQNYTTAAAWYRKAAEQGDVTAAFYLGLMYEEGKGVAQNYTTAVAWYRKAAEQGCCCWPKFCAFVARQEGLGDAARSAACGRRHAGS